MQRIHQAEAESLRLSACAQDSDDSGRIVGNSETKSELVANFRVARHSGGIGGIRFGFLSRLLIYAECLLGLGFDRGETLAVAISPERMWAYNTRFCRKPDNPVFQ